MIVGVEVLEDHILVLLLQRDKIALYLVSWKAGNVMLVNGLGRSYLYSSSGNPLKHFEIPVIR